MMTSDDRKLMKQHLEGDLAFGRTDHPPFAEAPDMADTLRFLEKVSRMPDIRFDKVRQMRELIARGNLETPERIEGTVRRLMDDLGL